MWPCVSRPGSSVTGQGSQVQVRDRARSLRVPAPCQRRLSPVSVGSRTRGGGLAVRPANEGLWEKLLSYPTVTSPSGEVVWHAGLLRDTGHGPQEEARGQVAVGNGSWRGALLRLSFPEPAVPESCLLGRPHGKTTSLIALLLPLPESLSQSLWLLGHPQKIQAVTCFLYLKAGGSFPISNTSEEMGSPVVGRAGREARGRHL